MPLQSKKAKVVARSIRRGAQSTAKKSGSIVHSKISSKGPAGARKSKSFGTGTIGFHPMKRSVEILPSGKDAVLAKFDRGEDILDHCDLKAGVIKIPL